MVVLQELTQSTFPVNTLLLGLPAETRAASPGAWVVAGANGLRWQRALGTFPHPNVLGGFLALTIVLLLPQVVTPRRLQLGAVTTWLIAWIELLLTFSRAAAVAAAIGCAAWLLAQATSKRSRQEKTLLAALVGVVSLGGLALLGREIVIGATPGGPDPAVTDRFALARIALGLISAHPVLGIGVANFSLIESLPPIDGQYVDPVHVVPLLVAAEAGVVAGLLWLGLILVPAVSAWRSRQRVDAESPHRLAVTGVILTLGSLDHYLWTLAVGRVMLWVALVFLYTNRPRLGVAR
jgi:O-antigen ligase